MPNDDGKDSPGQAAGPGMEVFPYKYTLFVKKSIVSLR